MQKPVLAHNEDGDFYVFPEDCFISKELLEGKRWEPFELSSIYSFLKPDSIVVDVGANLGTHTVCWAKYCNQGHVYSFEPHPLIYKQLVTNCFINNLDNVSTYNTAISDGIYLNFYLDKSLDNDKLDYKNNYGNVKIFEDPTTKDHDITKVTELHHVKITSLDKFFSKPEILLRNHKPDFIKIDVEGMEDKVILGAKNIIIQKRPVIMFECFESDSKAHQLLREFGYRIIWGPPNWLAATPDKLTW